MKDAAGVIVLDETLEGGVAPGSKSGLTATGTPGEWTIIFTLTNFDGDGSYSINPAGC